jgi:hypothetical protein
LRTAIFHTELQDGKTLPLMIRINEVPHALFPNAYNMSFGPLNERGQINDKAELPHKNYSKVFSTILFRALQYLNINPDHYIGVDGSDNNRAYYYWRFLQRNFDYLAQYFDVFGVKYYVRITRYGKHQYENPFDFDDIHPKADMIVKTNEWPEQMYNYFTFHKKQQY